VNGRLKVFSFISFFSFFHRNVFIDLFVCTCAPDCLFIRLLSLQYIVSRDPFSNNERNSLNFLLKAKNFEKQDFKPDYLPVPSIFRTPIFAIPT